MYKLYTCESRCFNCKLYEFVLTSRGQSFTAKRITKEDEVDFLRQKNSLTLPLICDEADNLIQYHVRYYNRNFEDTL